MKQLNKHLYTRVDVSQELSKVEEYNYTNEQSEHSQEDARRFLKEVDGRIYKVERTGIIYDGDLIINKHGELEEVEITDADSRTGFLRVIDTLGMVEEYKDHAGRLYELVNGHAEVGDLVMLPGGVIVKFRKGLPSAYKLIISHPKLTEEQEYVAENVYKFGFYVKFFHSNDERAVTAFVYDEGVLHNTLTYKFQPHWMWDVDLARAIVMSKVIGHNDMYRHFVSKTKSDVPTPKIYDLTVRDLMHRGWYVTIFRSDDEGTIKAELDDMYITYDETDERVEDNNLKPHVKVVGYKWK